MAWAWTARLIAVAKPTKTLIFLRQRACCAVLRLMGTGSPVDGYTSRTLDGLQTSLCVSQTILCATDNVDNFNCVSPIVFCNSRGA